MYQKKYFPQPEELRILHSVLQQYFSLPKYSSARKNIVDQVYEQVKVYKPDFWDPKKVRLWLNNNKERNTNMEVENTEIQVGGGSPFLQSRPAPFYQQQFMGSPHNPPNDQTGKPGVYILKDDPPFLPSIERNSPSLNSSSGRNSSSIIERRNSLQMSSNDFSVSRYNSNFFDFVWDNQIAPSTISPQGQQVDIAPLIRHSSEDQSANVIRNESKELDKKIPKKINSREFAESISRMNEEYKSFADEIKIPFTDNDISLLTTEEFSNAKRTAYDLLNAVFEATVKIESYESRIRIEEQKKLEAKMIEILNLMHKTLSIDTIKCMDRTRPIFIPSGDNAQSSLAENRLAQTFKIEDLESMECAIFSGKETIMAYYDSSSKHSIIKYRNRLIASMAFAPVIHLHIDAEYDTIWVVADQRIKAFSIKSIIEVEEEELCDQIEAIDVLKIPIEADSYVKRENTSFAVSHNCIYFSLDNMVYIWSRSEEKKNSPASVIKMKEAAKNIIEEFGYDISTVDYLPGREMSSFIEVEFCPSYPVSTHPVTSMVAFDDLIAVASNNHPAVYIYNSNKEMIARLIAHTEGITHLAIWNNYLVIGAADFSIRLYDYRSLRFSVHIESKNRVVTCSCLCNISENHIFFTGGYTDAGKSYINVFNINKLMTLEEIPINRGIPISITFDDSKEELKVITQEEETNEDITQNSNMFEAVKLSKRNTGHLFAFNCQGLVF